MATYQERLNTLKSAYNKRPGFSADPEAFYTPELQQQILSQLTQQAQDRGKQAQSQISGQAVSSGFGIGNTSREAARRAKADANTMDEVIGNYVNQAAQIEDMRVNQMEQDKMRKFRSQGLMLEGDKAVSVGQHVPPVKSSASPSLGYNDLLGRFSLFRIHIRFEELHGYIELRPHLFKLLYSFSLKSKNKSKLIYNVIPSNRNLRVFVGRS